MKQNLLLVFILSLSFSTSILAQELTPEMEQFINRMDSASLEDLEQDLDEGIKGLKLFSDFINSPDTKESKVYTKETEVLTEPFYIDTSKVQMALKQFTNIGFQQSFREDQSQVKFQKIDDRYWHKVSFNEGIEDGFNINTIYYKDGTTSTKNNLTNKVSFFWKEDWNTIKVIDSITVDYHLNYTKTYDSLLVTKKTKKLNYKDGFVKVKKLDKNHLYITVSDAYADNIYIRALNKDGKPLNNNSSSFSPTTKDKAGDNIKKTLTILEEVQAKLKSNQFKNTASLKKFLLKKMKKISTKKDTDGVFHLKYHFEGNIDTVKLYIQTEESHKTTTFTATNNNIFKDILLKETKGNIFFLDENGNAIFDIPARALERVGNLFFKENEDYLYLNLKTKTLDKIEAIKIFETTNNLIFIQKTRDTDFLVFDKNLNQLSDIQFTNVWSVTKTYAHTLDQAKNNYAINKNGTVIKMEGITEIGKMSEGLLIARLKDKYGFIDASGKIIVPLIYDDVEVFKEGLAVVKNKEGNYAYINKKNELVLGFNYGHASSFENGIALVYHQDKYALINKKGEILVKAKASGYSISGSGLNKTYRFGGKTYDALGVLISDEKTAQ